MSAKKNKTYKGIVKKYSEKIDQMLFSAKALATGINFVRDKMESGEFDDDPCTIKEFWLNHCYKFISDVEDELADLEKEIIADSQFTDKSKEAFYSEYFKTPREFIELAKRFDARVLNYQ